MGRKKQDKIKLTVWHRGGFHDKTGKLYTEAEGQAMLNSGKAVLTKWKGRRTPTKMPGPGRKAKVPNLKRVDGGYQNQHGVTFTEEQKKALERAVNRSNYKRKKQLKLEAEMVTDSGRSNADLHRLGTTSDFIIARQSRSLQGFHSMKEYDAFMRKQERIQSGEYLDDRTRLYKANHMQAIKNVFGDDAKDVLMKIRMMPVAEYREKLQKNEFLEVNYIYDPSNLAGKLNQIRRSLKMKEKEIPI